MGRSGQAAGRIGALSRDSGVRPARLEAVDGGVPASEVLGWLKRQPAMRRAPGRQGQRLSTGIVSLDSLLDGGLPQGSISEIVGPGTSGRTALSLSVLAAATARREAVAWIDPADALDPLSVRAAGVDLSRLLWIRPSGRDALKQALQAADMVLDAGGFAALVLDLAGSRARAMMDRPAWWIRLNRRLEATHTALLALSPREVTGSAGALRLGCRRIGKGYSFEVQVLRQRGGPPGGCTRVELAPPVD